MREILRQIGLTLAAGLCFTFAFTADKTIVAGISFALGMWVVLRTPKAKVAKSPEEDEPESREAFDETFATFEEETNPSPLPHSFPPIDRSSHSQQTTNITEDPWG